MRLSIYRYKRKTNTRKTEPIKSENREKDALHTVDGNHVHKMFFFSSSDHEWRAATAAQSDSNAKWTKKSYNRLVNMAMT